MKDRHGRRGQRPSAAKGGDQPRRAPAPPRAPARAPGRAADAPKSDAPVFRRPAQELAVIYGFHAVREALTARKRKCLDLFATEAAAAKLVTEIAASGVNLRLVSADALSSRLGAELGASGPAAGGAPDRAD